MPPLHRGRIQVQGSDINSDRSYSWAGKSPVSKTVALKELDLLKNGCDTSQLKVRKQAFAKAKKFIQNGPVKAVEAPIIGTFQDPSLPKDKGDA